jgi:small subunit ribosomal protein S9
MTQEPEAKPLPAGPYHYATGRRKTAVARVRIYSGSGTIEVNDKPYLELFNRVNQVNRIRRPLEIAGIADKVEIRAKIKGGGIAGWADALTHGIARALVVSDEKLKPALRKEGFMTRDPRIKERKKPGLKRARKAPQYTKR